MDQKAVGVIEAKPAGTTLSGVEWQSAMYAEGLPAEVRLKAVTTDGRKVAALPELDVKALRPAQITAIGGIERSLAEQRFEKSLKLRPPLLSDSGNWSLNFKAFGIEEDGLPLS
jgi:type I restriction enzyme R subunit